METSYPVLACGRCGRTTGWLAANGHCADCLRAELLHEAYADRHGGWVQAPRIDVPEPERAHPLPARAAAAIGFHRAVVHEWLRHVDPGETGPPGPRIGYELEVPVKTEETAADGSQLLVRFRSVRYRFKGDGWEPLVNSKLDPRTPDIFAAELEIVALAEAWADFRSEVAAFNRRAWTERSAREDAAREQADEAQIEAEARADRLRRERGTSGLLPD